MIEPAPGDLGRPPGSGGGRRDSLRQRRCRVVQPRDRGGVEVPQRHRAGHGGGQMTVEGSRVRDVARGNGGDGELEQVSAAADGTDREAAADDLAEQRQVRRQPEPALLAAEPVAQPLHLVQDEEHPVLKRQGGHCGQEPGRGRPDAAGAEERLGEDRGDVQGAGQEQRRAAVIRAVEHEQAPAPGVRSQ
jgi:hypothetical protein